MMGSARTFTDAGTTLKQSGLIGLAMQDYTNVYSPNLIQKVCFCFHKQNQELTECLGVKKIKINPMNKSKSGNTANR